MIATPLTNNIMKSKNLHLSTHFPILPNCNKVNKDLVASPFDNVRTGKKKKILGASTIGVKNKRFNNTSLDFAAVPIKYFNNQTVQFSPRNTQVFTKPAKYRHSPDLGNYESTKSRPAESSLEKYERAAERVRQIELNI